MIAPGSAAPALLCVLLALPAPVSVTAQTVSLEDLTAEIDAQAAQLDGFRALLTDPDPARAIAAMRAMLLSGDEVLVNLALDAGLTSSNGVMRKTALESFIAARPNLVASAELAEEGGDAAAFAQWMAANDYAMSNPTTGYIPISVPPYLEDARCYAVDQACRVRVAGGDLSVLLGIDWYQNWAGLELVEGGRLAGSVLSYGGPVSLSVDLLGAADQ